MVALVFSLVWAQKFRRLGEVCQWSNERGMPNVSTLLSTLRRSALLARRCKTATYLVCGMGEVTW